MSVVIRIEAFDPNEHAIFTYDMVLYREYSIDDIVEEWKEDGFTVLSICNLEEGTVIYDGIDL